MTLLRKISLFQFRNYNNSTYNIDASVTCICGKNGSGKTNLLDAIYTLCYTKSYFSATIQPTILHGTEGYRLEGIFEHENKNENIVCKYKNGKKEISCNHIIYEKHAEHIGKFAAVMIAPDDIALINEGSELRRKFIDGMLCQCNKQYFETLMNYQKILLQRNAWLKMYAQNTKNIDTTIIDYYNDILAPQGQFLFEMRKQFLKEFAPLLCKYYNLLAKEKESIDIEYQSDLYAHTLAYWLSEHLQHDMRYQRTLKGIHKDDFLLKINDLPIKNYGSQGQKKSFLFALKLAQHEYLKSQMNQRPLLLLDDVFEKLDQQRMEALLQIIQYPEFGQVILTDTHEHRVQEAFKGYNNNRLEFIRLH